MPRTSDDLFEEEQFTSVEDLKRRIPNAPLMLQITLQKWLDEHKQEKKQRVFVKKEQKLAIKRTVRIMTITRYGHRISIARDSRGRFVSSGFKRSKSRTYRMRKSKHARPEE